MTSTLDRIRADPRVESVDDERRLGNSVIVTLRYGWRRGAGDIGEHVFGEDTATAALRTLREVVPCTCKECERLSK